MTETYIPAIICTRWQECVADSLSEDKNKAYRNYLSFCSLLDAFLFDLMRDEPDNALTYALKGLKDEAKRRIKDMMPKGE